MVHEAQAHNYQEIQEMCSNANLQVRAIAPRSMYESTSRVKSYYVYYLTKRVREKAKNVKEAVEKLSNVKQ